MGEKVIKQKFILDESGSMAPQQQTIISGFNEQIETMKKEEREQGVKFLVTLIKFADKAEIVFQDKPLEAVPQLTEETYSPGGWTALYDAIGLAISKAAPGESDNIVTIMTDGHENRSHQWNKGKIKVLIELRQRENKWGFVYFGANQDAWSEASSLGVANAVNYTVANTDSMMKSMSFARCAYTTSVTSGTYDTSNLCSKIDESELTK